MFRVYTPHRTGTKRYAPKLQTLLWQREHLCDVAATERATAQRHYDSAQRLDLTHRQRIVEQVLQYYAKQILAYQLLEAGVERYWRTVCIGARHMADAPVPMPIQWDDASRVTSPEAAAGDLLKPPSYAGDYELCHVAWDELADAVGDEYRRAATLLATLADPTATARNAERAYRYLRTWAALAEQRCTEAEQCMCATWSGLDAVGAPAVPDDETADALLLPRRVPPHLEPQVRADTDSSPVECVPLISRRSTPPGARVDVCLPDCTATANYDRLRAALHDYDTRTLRPADQVEVDVEHDDPTPSAEQPNTSATERDQADPKPMADEDETGFVTIHVAL